jgi:hypothetical protein
MGNNYIWQHWGAVVGDLLCITHCQRLVSFPSISFYFFLPTRWPLLVRKRLCRSIVLLSWVGVGWNEIDSSSFLSILLFSFLSVFPVLFLLHSICFLSFSFRLFSLLLCLFLSFSFCLFIQYTKKLFVSFWYNFNYVFLLYFTKSFILQFVRKLFLFVVHSNFWIRPFIL